MELSENRAIDDKHSAMRQEDDRRRCYHSLVAATESWIRIGIFQATATMPSAQGSTEGRTPTNIREEEAQNGQYHHKGGHSLTLLGGREGRSADDVGAAGDGDADAAEVAGADAVSTAATHFTCN